MAIIHHLVIVIKQNHHRLLHIIKNILVEAEAKVIAGTRYTERKAEVEIENSMKKDSMNVYIYIK